MPYAPRTAAASIPRCGSPGSLRMQRMPTRKSGYRTLAISPFVNRTGLEAVGVRPAGLHAKMFAVEHGYDVTWYVGSANLTYAAFAGSNVEMMASVTGRKGGASGHGIARFLDGFRKLRAVRTEPKPVDAAEQATASLHKIAGARRARKASRR